MILIGDCRERLREMADGSVQTCVTSPPYFGLRDYQTASWEGGDSECDHLAGPLASPKSTLGMAKGKGSHDAAMRYATGTGVPYRDVCGKCGATRIDRQIGLESSLDAYVAELVAVFREVRRVLHDTGTLWLNLGDSYFSPIATQGRNESKSPGTSTLGPEQSGVPGIWQYDQRGRTYRRESSGLKPKDLMGVPWRVAFALQADGWYLRSDIVWHKPNPMPESVRDRPTKAHEYVFLLTKSPRYFYDAAAIAEPATNGERFHGAYTEIGRPDKAQNGRHREDNTTTTRNKRTVWTITPKPFKGAHFAVMPPALVEPCILAGSRPGDLVLDPFNGAGTVGVVALTHGRRYVGIELNPEYAAMARERIAREVRPRLLELPLFDALEGAAD